MPVWTSAAVQPFAAVALAIAQAAETAQNSRRSIQQHYREGLDACNPLRISLSYSSPLVP
jgi:hypothetical protein